MAYRESAVAPADVEDVVVRVGFIGLGTMGAAMAGNLLAAGHDLVVNDLRADAALALAADGAATAATPREVAEQSEVVLTSLPGPTEVTAAVTADDGILAGAAAGTVHLDLSTNAWSVVRSLAERAAAQGVAFLDAPVSGGPAGAASGRLAVWVGGDADAFARVRPVLDALADRVALVGEVGAGTVVKLAHNAAGNTINLVLAELFVLADAAGVDPLTVWSSLREGAVGRRRTFDGLAAHFLPQSYDPPALTLELARKDTALLLDLAESVGTEVPRARATLECMDAAVERGWGQRDSRVTMLLEQQRRGRELAALDPADIAAVLDGAVPAAPDPDTT